MIKTEAQSRKLNEDLFFQYLLGIKKNAEKADAEAWETYHRGSIRDSDNYIRYARASERLKTLEEIIKAYVKQIRGGMTI